MRCRRSTSRGVCLAGGGRVTHRYRSVGRCLTQRGREGRPTPTAVAGGAAGRRLRRYHRGRANYSAGSLPTPLLAVLARSGRSRSRGRVSETSWQLNRHGRGPSSGRPNYGRSGAPALASVLTRGLSIGQAITTGRPAAARCPGNALTASSRIFSRGAARLKPPRRCR